MNWQREQLRVEIRSRKFRRMEIDNEIGWRIEEIRKLIGNDLTNPHGIHFQTIAQRAGECAGLWEEWEKLNGEIEQGEKELNG